MSATKSYPILKLLLGLLLGILGLWLIYVLLFGTGYGLNIGVRGNFGGGHMYMGTATGIGFAGSLSLILLFLIKVLFVLFIIGLVVGIAIAIKNYIFTTEDVQKIKSTFTGKKTVIIKEVCGICGKELNDDWKLCPHCGKEKEIKTA